MTTGSGAPRVVVVDYGAGNLVSIEQALSAAGASVSRALTGEDIDDPDLLVVPGVGAAAPAMDRLREGGFLGPIRAWIDADRPFLGICLGLQLLYEGSDEDGAATLGILPGRTVRLDGRAHAPAHRLEPGGSPTVAPGLRGHRGRRGLLLRPLLRRGARLARPPTS